jgi:predicted nuclease of predicted toxin-antitoxin system
LTLWIDAQLSPILASWISNTFNDVKAFSISELGYRDAKDGEIYAAAKKNSEVVIVTKDSDFINLVHQLGSPPKVIWITCGNTSNDYLRKMLVKSLSEALALLNKGESIVEISDSYKGSA